MSEAVQAVLDYGFTQMGLESIMWRCAIHDGVPNWPSAKVAWRAGFTFEGRIRKMLMNKGHAIDCLIAKREVFPDAAAKQLYLLWHHPNRPPPLIITEADVAEAVSRLDKTAGAIEAALKRPAAE